ncbi:hypothetical protein D3C71_835250 [compost metagenome]
MQAASEKYPIVPVPELIVTTLDPVKSTVAGEQTAGGLVTVICGDGNTVTEVVNVELQPVTEVMVH